jgi:hypothetical protein
MLDVSSLMSDSLDPADAILGGATEGVKRLVAFFLVTAGAAMLGLNLHEAPNYIASMRTNGIGAVFDVFKQFNAGSPLLWILMMLHSMFIWYLIPFTLAYLWLLIRMWSGADMFSVLLALALIHPVHVFLYVQRSSWMSTGNIILASALLFFCEIAMAGLVLWWRHIRESAPPQPMETEPEL